MKKILCLGIAFLFIADAGSAASRSIAVGSMMDNGATDRGITKPQIQRDLEGLDPREGRFSQGLRGSFTVKHYISGPWRGGTAVIELASDLSYAEIRIFDKDGGLQRIYSVQPKAQNARLNPANINNPMKMVEESNMMPDAAQSGSSSARPSRDSEQEPTRVTRSPEREAAVQAQTEQAVAAGRQERAEEYRGTVSNRAGEIREGSTQEAIEARERQAQAPKKKTIRVRRKRSAKKSKNGLDTPLSGSSEESDYYYEEVVVVEKSNTPEAVAAQHETKREPAPEKQQAPITVASANTANTPPRAAAVSMSRVPSEPVAMHPTPVQRGGPSGSQVPPTRSPAPGTAAYDESNLPDVTDAVSENEKETSRPAGKRSVASDQWTPKPTPAAAVAPEPVVETPEAPPSKPKRTEPVEDISEAQKAAAKLDSDAWSPKPSAAAPSDAELGLTNMPEGSGSRGRSSNKSKGRGGEAMVPMSDQVKGGHAGEGGEDWAPSSPAKLSAKEEQTLAMVNALKQPTNARPVKVNRDVNNPEEGVLPFYSLEKFSGAQFGRHREFERRVMYKQNKKSSLRGYDFYIDEVDRKQEKHYLYYYKIESSTKKAKLIATEKHEKVTFLGNYDIGSEDKGKVVKE